MSSVPWNSLQYFDVPQKHRAIQPRPPQEKPHQMARQALFRYPSELQMLPQRTDPRQPSRVCALKRAHQQRKLNRVNREGETASSCKTHTTERELQRASSTNVDLSGYQKFLSERHEVSKPSVPSAPLAKNRDATSKPTVPDENSSMINRRGMAIKDILAP